MFLSGNLIIWVVESHGSGSANQMCSCWGWYSGQDVYADLIYHRQLPRGICPYSVSMSATDSFPGDMSVQCRYVTDSFPGECVLTLSAFQWNMSIQCRYVKEICLGGRDVLAVKYETTDSYGNMFLQCKYVTDSLIWEL